MIKAVFFDIDGTLLSHRTHQVPTSTKKAIQLLKEKVFISLLQQEDIFLKSKHYL